MLNIMATTRLSRRGFVTATAAAAIHAADFQAHYPATLTRPWLGADYWANPFQDWRVRNGRMECWVSGGGRNVSLLTREVSKLTGDFTMTVQFGRMEEDSQPLAKGFVGFRTGVRGRFHDYRDTAVHGRGIDSGIAADGSVFIHDIEPGAPKAPLTRQELELRLSATPASPARYDLSLQVLDKEGRKLAEVKRSGAPNTWIEGGVALVCSAQATGTQRGGNMRFWFQDWSLKGSKVTQHSDRSFGPILFAMHTLSRRVLKLTVQFPPLEPGRHEALLQTKTGAVWRTIARSPLHPAACTATFRAAGWDDTRDTPYRISFTCRNEAGEEVEHTFDGVIRKDPAKEKLTVGALTCCNDAGFPHQDIVSNLRHFQPDILLFTGDQIYEGVGGFGNQLAPLEQATHDYLRKWFLFGWSFGDLMREIPTVCMPDDHDVYHGNVWGSGGKKAVVDPKDLESMVDRTDAWQDSGGYKMPAEWVNVVQRTQTSHLPDPFDPTPVLQNISVYYTSLLYGGVSFAIIEDRKWKSSPRNAIPWADIRNGWAQNPKYNGAKDGDVPGAELLGERQMRFLDHWAQDWRGAFLKILVSQTLWANLCTLPPPANTDAVTGKLPILKPGEYAEGEVLVCDHDSNGWPQTPRTRGVRAMRKALAFHIGGDQHLASTVRYGIDEFNDGPYMLCTPAISNIFPRRWFPPTPGANRPEGAPRYCGEYLDGFGNRITVHAVANPQQYGWKPGELFDRSVGYGIVEVERATRRITLANWPRHVDATKPGTQPYPGWPIVIHQFDNGIHQARYELEPVTAPTDDMVAQVVDESNREIVYTVRIAGRRFAPGVFHQGRYTVRLIPDKGKPVQIRGLTARLRGKA